jgi:hypothetical protein
MDTFEKSVLTVALILLVIMLIVTGMSLKNANVAASTTAGQCPDFWLSSYFRPCLMTEHGCCPDGVTAANADASNCSASDAAPYGYCPDGTTLKTSDTDNCEAAMGPAKCWNIHGLGTQSSSCNKIDDYSMFDASGGDTSLCKKQTWSNTCQLSWEGVTNLPSDCS